MEIDENLKNKLVGIYFRLNRVGFGDNTEEDLGFIRDNKFKVIVTDKTKNNGYPFDSEKVKAMLEINTPYTLENMVVESWCSVIYLKEFPNENFNSANFEFLKKWD